MTTILPIDEINRFKEELPIHYEDGRVRSKEDERDIYEELEDLFLYALAKGMEGANSDLGKDIQLSIEEVEDILYQPVAGKVWTERVEDYFEGGGTEADISRIAETEAHRIANEAAYDTARKGGATTKTWNCLFINSRDTHEVLDGVSAPIDGYFYTFLGNSTLFPGQFGVPEEDVNCNCWLTFSR